MEDKGKKLLGLFTGMLGISTFTFGGGFVIVSLMRRKFVDQHGWISDQEMLDMTAMAQSAPGAIAVNAAVLLGWRVAGLTGMLCAVLGTILPPLVLLSVITLCYEAFSTNVYVAHALVGMQAGAAAVVADVALTLAGGIVASRSPLRITVMAAAFVAALAGVNTLWVLLGAVAVGLIVCLYERRANAA